MLPVEGAQARSLRSPRRGSEQRKVIGTFAKELGQLLAPAVLVTLLCSPARTLQGAESRAPAQVPELRDHWAIAAIYEAPREVESRAGKEIITEAQFARAYALASQFAEEQCLCWALDRAVPDVVCVTKRQALGMADGRKARGIYGPWLICLTPWALPSTWLHELAHHFGEVDEATCRQFAEWASERVAPAKPKP